MIHSENGNVKISGQIEEITADVSFVIAAIVSELKEHDVPVELFEYAVRTSVKDLENKVKEGHATRIVTDQRFIDILGGDKDE